MWLLGALVLAWVLETAFVAVGLAICVLRRSTHVVSLPPSAERDKLTPAGGAPA